MATVDGFLEFLRCKYPLLETIFHSYKFCSKNKSNNSYLVENLSHCINFDILTKWECGDGHPRQSADSLSFNDSEVFLIEFKSGNQIDNDSKYKKLLKGVSGKIKDSDLTMGLLFKEAFKNNQDFLYQNFCLIVDSKSMGIDPLGFTLAQLSIKDNDNPDHRIIRMLQDIKMEVDGISDHYKKIEIWYSQLFDLYLSVNRINSVTLSRQII